ncbi:ACP S-malonyltransferase [Aliikangiella sp. IMCC44359]|uniref:ACP S-malonyltransferase n=1 Tax=Aliikangiella sp. IMCC44359 TaxID=3459125 RepID=UPI00403B1355
MLSAFVFPGQGSQHLGMGKKLFNRYPSIVEQAEDILGYSIKELCLNDPDKVLNLTQFTQPALYTVSVLHYLEKIESIEQSIDFLVGHSLGEYTALFAAGAFDFETGLRIVKKRGELMASAPKGAMAAVVGLNMETVFELLASSQFDRVEMANINSASQIVISGARDQIFAAETLFSNAGAHFIPLKVSAGFHSSLMKNVANEFYQFIQQFSFSTLKTPVISNCSARQYPSENYLKLMKNQIDHSVRWYESISWILQQGETEFEEVGPGSILTKMIKTIKTTPYLFKDEDKTEQKSELNNFLQEPPVLNINSRKVFMFAGQGSQYRLMGQQFYQNEPGFRASIDHCEKILLEKSGISLKAELFHPQNFKPLKDVRITHPVILCFQYAVAEMMKTKNIIPDAIVGHSLGEYVAAVVAGAISLSDAIDLVLQQAFLLYKTEISGAMLVVNGESGIFSQQNHLFHNLHIAGRNYENSFLVTGHDDDVDNCISALNVINISCQKLPVNIAFHCELVDMIEEPFTALAKKIKFSKPKIPVFTCTEKQENSDDINGASLWAAVRDKVNFIETINKNFTENDFLLDLSPSGSLSTFIRHSKIGQYQHTYVLNQFGQDLSSLKSVLLKLKPEQKVA